MGALPARGARDADREPLGMLKATILLAGEEDLPRTGRLAAPSPSSALDKRRAPPAPIAGEAWSKCPKHGRAEYHTSSWTPSCLWGRSYGAPCELSVACPSRQGVLSVQANPGPMGKGLQPRDPCNFCRCAFRPIWEPPVLSGKRRLKGATRPDFTPKAG